MLQLAANYPVKSGAMQPQFPVFVLSSMVHNLKHLKKILTI